MTNVSDELLSTARRASRSAKARILHGKNRSSRPADNVFACALQLRVLLLFFCFLFFLLYSAATRRFSLYQLIPFSHVFLSFPKSEIKCKTSVRWASRDFPGVKDDCMHSSANIFLLTLCYYNISGFYDVRKLDLSVCCRSCRESVSYVLRG